MTTTTAADVRPGNLYQVKELMPASTLGQVSAITWLRPGQVLMFLGTTDHVYRSWRPEGEVRTKDYYVHVLVDEKKLWLVLGNMTLENFVKAYFDPCQPPPL